jgi:hypothetical protein
VRRAQLLGAIEINLGLVKISLGARNSGMSRRHLGRRAADPN